MSVGKHGLEPGALIGGRYRVAAALARGGMGAVFEAWDERLERTVAVKVLRVELAEDANAHARFERETRLVARLTHPNLALVLDFGTMPDGAPYLVMERVPGITWTTLLQTQGRVAPARAVELVRQVLDGLGAAHAAGIVHRDLKPGNVMVFATGEGREMVKVLDFGIACLTESTTYMRLTATGAILGTPSYMAPEQTQGARVDARTDVYGVGVLLYCLVAGRRPFEGPDAAAVLEAIVGQAPPPLARIAPEVPPAVVAVIERALAKRPEDRFQSAAEMSRALLDALDAPRHAPRVSHPVMQPARLTAMTPLPPTPSRPTVPPVAAVSSAPPAWTRGLPPWLAAAAPWIAALSVLLVVLIVGITTLVTFGVFVWAAPTSGAEPVASAPLVPVAAPAPVSVFPAAPQAQRASAACERLVLCCMSVVQQRVGGIDASVCPLYRSSLYSPEECVQATVAFARLLGAEHRDARVCTAQTPTNHDGPPAVEISAEQLTAGEVTLTVTAGGTDWAHERAGVECRGGGVPTTPQVRFVSDGGIVTISTNALLDTTLMVRLPSGRYRCNDDGGGGRNARLQFAPGQGTVDVYVGTFSGGTGPATLTVRRARP